MLEGVFLSTLLSYALVAFTIELDNEFERQIAPSGRAPVFLTSLPMWSNYLRFVSGEGVSTRKLATFARDSDATVKSRLAGLERWGYVRVAPEPEDACSKPPYRDWLVRATPQGKRAHDIWYPLPEIIEHRWRDRLGAETVERLREHLGSIADRVGIDWPLHMPVVAANRQMFSEVVERDVDNTNEGSELPLFALLAGVLLAFTLEFESESDLSLPVSANVLYVLDGSGTAVRELPQRTGLSKEATAMAVGNLVKNDFVAVEPDPAAVRVKNARLTAKGEQAQRAHRQRHQWTEQRLRTQFGAEVSALYETLAAIVGSLDLADSPLLAGMVPPAAGWRASRPAPHVLPNHPMVLNRGGWPDGS